MPTQLLTGWEIQYIDPDVGFPQTKTDAEIDQIYDDLDGENSKACFRIPNTSANRDFCQNHEYQVLFWYNNELQFSGILEAADSTGKWIKVYVFDAVFIVLDESEPITGVYDGVPANQVMADVLEGTGIMLGDCPTTEVTFVLFKAVRTDVARFIAESLGLDCYSTDGTTINIGYRHSNNWYPQADDVIVSTHGFDKTKFADKVIIRGIDTFGNHIAAEAGSNGIRVRTFNEDTPTNYDGLVNIAAKKLVELNTNGSGAPLSFKMSTAYPYAVGDTLTVYKPKYFMYGNSSRIINLTKQKTKAQITLDFMRPTIAKSIADLRNWEKNGIYLPGCTSWSISLQYLVAFYHLTEGTGTAAADSSPSETPNTGTIVNGHWDDSPIGGGAKVLGLVGDGYVDCGNGISLSANGSCFSVGGWFSPSELNSTERFLAHKSGQFSLSYIQDTLRFVFTDDSANSYHWDFAVGKIKAYGRHFVMITYDGHFIKFYLNAQLLETVDVEHMLASSTNNVYLGMFLQGNIAEMMLWNRCLLDQEVTELYFFPLNRVV